MYFPLVRGKQYELLALRDFAKEIKNSGIIKPIIEPVKIELRGLETCLNELITNNINLTIIINPIVGEVEDLDHILSFISNNPKLANYSNFMIGIQAFSEKQMVNTFQSLNKYGLQNHNLILIHNDVISNEEFVRGNLNTDVIKYNLFNSTKIRAKRYRRLFDSNTRVSLDDVFLAKGKNADYLSQTDEFFSDEHLNYLDEGNVGFSDFITIGESYSEAGFLPYAVAVHITYEAKDGSIRIRHFVSDSNDDYSDTPGKFAEALKKLIAFIPELNYKTKAIKEFENYFSAGHYPGLGSIKKLSILNHLELMNYILSRV